MEISVLFCSKFGKTSTSKKHKNFVDESIGEVKLGEFAGVQYWHLNLNLMKQITR